MQLMVKGIFVPNVADNFGGMARLNKLAAFLSDFVFREIARVIAIGAIDGIDTHFLHVLGKFIVKTARRVHGANVSYRTREWHVHQVIHQFIAIKQMLHWNDGGVLV